MNEWKPSDLSDKHPNGNILKKKKQGSFFLCFKDVSPSWAIILVILSKMYQELLNDSFSYGLQYRAEHDDKSHFWELALGSSTDI